MLFINKIITRDQWWYDC